MRAVLLLSVLVVATARAQAPDSLFERLLRAPQTNAVRDSLWDLVARAPADQRDALRRRVLGSSPLHSDKPAPKLTAGRMYYQDSNGDGHVRIRAWAKD